MIEFLNHLLSENINRWAIGICFFVPAIILLVSRRNFELPIVQAIPGFCTAIGIMFTFGIIYKSLGMDETLFQSNNLEDLKKVVKTLSTKFSCSLIGVVFSIGWNLFIKSRLSYIESQSRKREVWLKKDPQEMLWSLNENFIDMIKEYRYNTEFVTKAIYESSDNIKNPLNELLNLVKSFDQEAKEDLQKTFSELKSAVQKSLQQVSKEAIKESQGSVTKANEDFLSSAKEMQTANNQELQLILASTAGALEKTLNKLEEIGSNIQGKLEDTRQEAEKGASEVAKGFETSASTIKENVTGLMLEIQGQFSTLNDYFSNLNGELQNSTQQILDNNLEKINKAFDQLNNIQANSINRLEESTKQFNESVHAYEQVQVHQYGVLERVQHQIVLLKQMQENAEKQMIEWESQVDQMELVKNRVADIANTIDQLQGIKDWLAANSPRN